MSHISSPPPAGLPATREVAAAPPAAMSPPRGPAVRPTIQQFLLDRHRLDGWTATKVAAFIEVLGDTGSVTRAAACVGMSASSAYRLRNRPGAELFAEAWEAAIGARHEMLADIAMARIQDGVEHNRWWRGELVGVDRVFSDRLLMFMLTATSPDRPRRPGAATAATPGLAPPEVAGHLPEPSAEARALLAAADAATPDGGPERAAGCRGDCPVGDCAACDTPPPSAKALYDAAIRDETALPPDVEAAMLAQRERATAEMAAEAAGIAAIGAALDTALGRSREEDNPAPA